MKPARRVPLGAVLLGLGVLGLGAADATLLALTTGYFGAGYNSPVLRGAAAVASFAAAGAVLDAFLLSALFAVAVQLGRAFRLEAEPRLAFAAALTGFLPVAFDVARHRVHRVFGNVLGLDALVQLAGGRMSDAALEALSEAPALALMLGCGLLATSAAVRFARRGRGRLVLPTRRGLATTVLASGALGAAILAAGVARAPVLGYGLERKASGQLLGSLLRNASDVDRDGFGWLSRPADPAPFDGSRHPYALDASADGVDQNGVGGDHPADFAPQRPFPPPARLGAARPPFLLIFLESFRGDLVGRRLHGREVTPTLNRLAERGASSERAYAHTPLTWPSRAQLFQGRIAPAPRARTLIDDFRELGYRVGYFSGQNDLHGGSADLVGFERADRFYDARASSEQRTSRTTLPVSLQVSAATVLAEVRRYLDETAGDPRPLFLYVNLVDNHYPYDHPGVERLLDVAPVTRAEIRPEHAERVFETYLQSSAHVDRAIGELVALWEERMGPAPLLVTADHGQSFYEQGMLGHGQSLGALQSRVPFVLVGVGGAWPEPLGLADVRGLLLTHLFEGPGRPRVVVEPERRLFQYVGVLEHPYQVGLRGAEVAVGWDFARAEGRDPDRPDARIDDAARLLPVVWSFEAWQAESLATAPPH